MPEYGKLYTILIIIAGDGAIANIAAVKFSLGCGNHMNVVGQIKPVNQISAGRAIAATEIRLG
jgi:hypothetical protein